ncbi:MAG: trypsin-like serine protease [Hyalangium sp.]|uniref:trypsin-like serine protease n=1 Tax=Hyalangium sp. TaxID=2028555 RepID=UPI00389B286B
MDTTNRFLPTVRVATALTNERGEKSYKPCSGVLIHPRLVITAGHCVCWSRPATPQEQPSQTSSTTKPQKPAKKDIKTRAEELRGVTLTEIIDKHSPCAKATTVTTTVYSPSKKGVPGSQTSDYKNAEIVPHPDLEVLIGIRNGRPETVWSNADLAAIFLKNPVELDFQPMLLPEAEVQIGDAIEMAGYGMGDSSSVYGDRQFGENKVTRLLMLETGHSVFRAEAQRLSDGTVAAHTGIGDSGGACVKKASPTVLVGIVSIGARTQDGGKMSVFTSVYSHRKWLEQALKRANKI